MAISNVLRTRLKFEIIQSIENYLDTNPHVVQQYKSGLLDDSLREQAQPAETAEPAAVEPAAVEPVAEEPRPAPPADAKPAETAKPLEDADLVSDQEIDDLVAAEVSGVLKKASDEDLGLTDVEAEQDAQPENPDAVKVVEDVLATMPASGPTEDQIARLAEHNVALRFEYYEDD